jgi:hypothetical protein
VNLFSVSNKKTMAIWKELVEEQILALELDITVEDMYKDEADAVVHVLQLCLD